MIKSVREFLVDIAENEPLTLEELRQMDGEPVRHGIWTSIADGDKKSAIAKANALGLMPNADRD